MSTTRFIALSGFLGSGKTTAMLAAAQKLESKGRKVAVITNDQAGNLVDTSMAARQTTTMGEVTGGCFCCRFNDLMDVTARLLGDGVDTVIAESVGSCTDLQATIIRPLLAQYDEFCVSPLTTIVDPARVIAFSRATHSGKTTDLVYLFQRQLLDAEMIAISKADMYSQSFLDEARAAIEKMAPGKRILTYSAVTGDGLDGLLDAWEGQAIFGDHDLEVDYDRYATAEAQLAWGNAVLVVKAAEPFTLPDWTEAFLSYISKECDERDYAIGHVKVLLRSSNAIVKGALINAGQPPSVAVYSTALQAESAEVTINARVSAPPVGLDTLVQAGINHAALITGAYCDEVGLASFQPGYPTPTHRILVAN